MKMGAVRKHASIQVAVYHKPKWHDAEKERGCVEDMLQSLQSSPLPTY
jgi:hypothetical protein